MSPSGLLTGNFSRVWHCSRDSVRDVWRETWFARAGQDTFTHLQHVIQQVFGGCKSTTVAQNAVVPSLIAGLHPENTVSVEDNGSGTVFHQHGVGIASSFF
jgi:hypothetical protein